MKRDFISLDDWTRAEMAVLFELAAKLKRDRSYWGEHLRGKSVGLVFQKPSNRTRVSFEVGIAQLGGNCLYLVPGEINLGVRESIADVSRTLSRYLNGIVARTNTHAEITELAKYSSVPVINGLSDLYHPCQALADLFSIKEKLGAVRGVTLAFIGDGNNVCHSLLLGCAKLGVNMYVATPKKYAPQDNIVELAKSYAKETGAKIMLTQSPKEAAQGADVIYSDVWISMGQEEESKTRLKDFKGYQVNKELAQLANKDFIFMH